jgi:battenin
MYSTFGANQLVYQTTVFFSRSSISLGFTPLPARLLPLPALIQLLILVLLMFESGYGVFPAESEAYSFLFVFLLISVEGFCGGLA